MLLATLFMASVLNRYQAHQARLRAAVRRLEGGLLRTTDALAKLGAVPLSRELRVTLRGDVLARYQRIRRLYRRYPDIARRIAEAEQAMNAEGAPTSDGVGAIEDEQAFRSMNGAIKELIAVIEQGDTLQPIPTDVRKIFRRELGERHAEVMARFHLVAARRYSDDRDLTRARAHLTTLLQLLRRYAPKTPFVAELVSETQTTLGQLGRKDGEGDSVAAGVGQLGAA
jgi:DNA repair ATPase RecN